MTCGGGEFSNWTAKQTLIIFYTEKYLISVDMQGVESTEAEILLELGDTAHEELPAKGRRAMVL